MDLKALKAIRTPYRTLATRICNKIEEKLNNTSTPIEDFEDLKIQLDEKTVLLKDLNEQILPLTDEKDIESEIFGCAEYSDKMRTLKLKIDRKILKFNNSTSGSQNVSGFESLNLINTVHLPKLQIDKYYGERDKYLNFWSQFENAVHKNPSLTDVDRFSYLKSLLGGSAANAVSGFALTAENYKIAIEILQSRFGRHSDLVQAHLNNLLNIQGVKNSRDLYALRALYDKCIVEIRSLESLNVAADTYSTLLCPLNLKVLPSDLTLRFTREQSQKTNLSFQDLMEFIRAEIETKERVYAIQKAETQFPQGQNIPNLEKNKFAFNKSKNFSKKPFHKRNITNTPSAVELLTPLDKCCMFCSNSNHDSESCCSLTVDEKRAILKRTGRCFICLKSFHRMIDCPKSDKSRTFCTKKHNVTLCYRKENLKDKGVRIPIRFYIAFLTRVVKKLLSGKISRSLKLRTLGKEELLIHTFGSKIPRRHVCPRVEVKIKNKLDCTEFKIEAFEIDEITHATLESPPAEVHEELKSKGILLADVCDNAIRGKGISLLIGADNWKIVTGKIERLNSALVATESKLGWLLMGKLKEDKTDFELGNKTFGALSISSLFVHSPNIENLWKLDALGIRDPTESKNLEQDALDTFEKTVRINDEGRYEIRLPRLEGFEDLDSNLETAKQRCRSTTNKLLRENKGVYKEHSTAKVRPVFDASCKTKQMRSVNDFLLKSPNLLEQIPPLLIKFRKDKIGVTSDIKKAFLQISVAKEDRDFLRFLWWENIEEREFRAFRHDRLVFELNCSPFLLSSVLNHLITTYSSQFPETCNILRNAFYVDNCVTSVSDEKKLNQFIHEPTYLMNAGCFDLRGWEYTTQNFEEKSEPISVLGLLWNKHEDVLFCQIKNLDLDSLEITRRNILSIVHKIFDVIGILCPTTLIPKLILQKSWGLKLGWDTPLPDEFKIEFEAWAKDLHLLSEVRVPRYINTFESAELSLHTFCDGSKSAYSAVVFLRSGQYGNVHVQLVQAKSRVAPLRKTTIPRMELLGCCIGTRLAFSTLQALNIPNLQSYFWTDSSTALTWIKKNEPWGVFVENRVKEIRKLVPEGVWGLVPSSLNAADLPSRGCSIKTLIKSDWCSGPDWLKKNIENWPDTKLKLDEEEVSRERRKQVIQAVTSTSQKRWYLRYFSKYFLIVRMISWIIRFVINCKTPKTKLTGELTVNEIDVAEKKLWKIVQEETFLKNVKLKNLCTFVDQDGLIRLKTKIIRREDDEYFRCPILLPSDHKLVEYLIIDYHQRFSHAGVQFVICNIRQKFRILRGKKTVHRVLNKCIRCKRYKVQHPETVPSPLPEDRIREALVFEVTGIDVAGPLYLKKGKKVWILLFTCAVYRAVHLELIDSMSTDVFLLGLRRFIARRGRPKVIYTDNGTNFVGADNLLKFVDWRQIECDSSVSRIQWKFNPPTACWWGGWWERLVQMVKKLLRNILGKSCVSYEELLTILCDVESVINGGPLTCVSEDPNDLVPLTPSMFLQDISQVGVPDLDHLDAVNLNKRHQFLQHLRQQFRKRFRDEYLSLLIQRSPKRPPKSAKE
ncbi:uncharacterized protein LOC129226652 [Uloborus diversus]|uniref:uncharacterized protein LOC129226652 n=1 Tax=Uloborus diversus TaxID=327109 RepID=UPI002408F727|nr:uncharacterized protein LOC129226652 [Uloborus diversus]